MRRILCSIPLLCLLVLPLSAQDEALHGTWEGGFVDEEGNNATVRLTFKDGGAFELYQEITLGDAFQSVVASTDIPVEKFTAEGSGTYQVDGDKLQVEITELEMLVGGRPFIEVLTEVAKALAAFAAGFAGISEADYPAFEANFVSEFLGEISQEDFLADFSGEEVTWSVDGDTLTITSPTEDGGEETSQYQRVSDDMTAVTATTWGHLKANQRR